MSFEDWDEDKRIMTSYFIFLEGISLDFDSSWTPGSEVQIYMNDRFGDETRLYSIHDCPRSLAWDTSTPLYSLWGKLCVDYTGCDGGPSRTCVIAEHEGVQTLARNAEYRCGVAQLEIKRELGFGMSIVRFTVHKRYEYDGADSFKLSVIIENINRDEWNKLLEYAKNRGIDRIAGEVPYAWRGNKQIIEQMPKSPWQDDRSDVMNNIRHVAHESMALALKYEQAQSEAIERGLSLDDFQWEFPDHRETRVVRRPSAQTDIPLRALRLDISMFGDISAYSPVISLYICSIELNLTSITRSPSLSNNLASCTIRLDPPYAALANATIPNHSSQIIEIPTDSELAERVTTTSGSIHVNGTLQIMGSVMGDMYTGPISGNVGGQNNTNHFTAPPTFEAVVSAVMQVMRSAPNGGIPQTEGRRKRKRARARHSDEAGVDVEPPRKRRARQSRP